MATKKTTNKNEKLVSRPISKSTSPNKTKNYMPLIIGVIIAVVGIGYGIYSSNQKQIIGNDKDKVVELNSQEGSLKSLLFGKNNYDLSYAEYDAKAVELISDFEPNSSWQGEAFVDRRIFMEGISSLGLTSAEHELANIFLEKEIDMSDVKYLEFYLNLSDSQALELAQVKLGDTNLDNYYIYTLSNLNEGWNFLQIPLEQFVIGQQAEVVDEADEFNWSKIGKIQFEIMSRPNNTVIANFDYLTLQRDDSYLKDWMSRENKCLGLGKNNDQINLLFRNQGSFTATLNEVSGVDDFEYKAKITPQIKGRAGLFFRGDYKNSQGYYYMIGGIDTNTWSLMKYGQEGWETLTNGRINNFTFEKNKEYWLSVKASGNNLVGYLSTDNNQYSEIFSINDEEMLSGGVGVAVLDSAFCLFNDFSVKR
ncbi:MAG: CIA30 family protein [Patescibacteria group bacterium]|nr:CIA30 family protein [Patescibacteria group bacterium]